MKTPILRVIFFFLLVSGAMILPLLLHLDQVPYHPNAEYTDLLTSHWPNFYYVKTEWQRTGEFPLWNTQILSGAPLVADPLFSLFYPPFWLAFILPILPAFNLLVWLHLACAGIGFTLLMRNEGLDWVSSVIAGIAFSATPKLIGHIGLGHLTMVCAVSWTPWVLLSIRHTVGFSAHAGRFARWAGFSGALHGLVFLIDPRWLIPVGLLSTAYALWKFWQNDSIGGENWSRWIRPVFYFGVTMFGVAAVLLMPMYEFVRLSTRAVVSISEASELSLPFSSLLGLVLPNLGGSPEILAFFGLTVLSFALLAALANAKGWRFWLGIAGLSLIFAVGDQLPIYPLLARVIPGFGWMRVPARFIFLTAFASAALAGIGTAHIFASDMDESSQKRVRLGALGINLFIILLGLFLLFGPNDSLQAGGILMVSVPLGILALIVTPRKRSSYGGMFLAGILFFELLIFNRSLIEARPLEPIQELPVSMRESRLLSPSYSLPQDQAVRAGIQLSDGVNPIQLERYWTYMAGALGFDEDMYSVTLPPFADGDPSARQSFSIDLEKLNKLGISTILSAYPLGTHLLVPEEELDGKYLYTINSFRPRAWIETSFGTWKDVDHWTWAPNHIELLAEGPGTLVLSEVVYPGWIAKVDGERVPIQVSDDLFRSIELGSGEHEIIFKFQPLSFYLGLGITLVTLILLTVFWRRA